MWKNVQLCETQIMCYVCAYACQSLLTSPPQLVSRTNSLAYKQLEDRLFGVSRSVCGIAYIARARYIVSEKKYINYPELV